MDVPPEQSKPLVRTEVAVRCLASAVEHILKQRNRRLNLVAMSWGSSVAGAYTADNNDKVVKLALVTPLWLLQGPAPIDAGGCLGGYCKVPVLDFRKRWLSAAPEAARSSLPARSCIMPATFASLCSWSMRNGIRMSHHLGQDFFLSLRHAPYRRWVGIGEGMHMVLLEKNRLQALDAINQFLAGRL
ncbi:pimeloyl-ACP methyl ester carboxylesterase [Bradyrhizobium sp. USDA 326]|uniref:hypothetical protein n=1 Tax=unclassified Bradyrhizobium TaxID=2631580 RepID=UPI003517818D